MTTRFIYKPTSGSRVFAHTWSPEIMVFEWRNGSKHVVGGTYLVLRPDGSGLSREIARRLAGDTVNLHGGLAWDEQGSVQVILTCAGIKPFVKAVKALSRASHLLGTKLDFAYIGSQLYLQGMAYLDHGGVFAPSVPPPDDIRLVTVDQTSWREGFNMDGSPLERRLVIETSHGLVVVPESWVPEGSEWLPPSEEEPEPDIGVHRSVPVEDADG